MATAQAIRPQTTQAQQQKELTSVFTNSAITGRVVSFNMLAFNISFQNNNQFCSSRNCSPLEVSSIFAKGLIWFNSCSIEHRISPWTLSRGCVWRSQSRGKRRRGYVIWLKESRQAKPGRTFHWKFFVGTPTVKALCRLLNGILFTTYLLFFHVRVETLRQAFFTIFKK